MNWYRKFLNLLCGIFEGLGAFMVTLMILIIFFHVIMRYFFNMAPSWTEEVARQLMICFCFIAMMLGVKEKIHIALTIFVDHLPRNAIYVIELINKTLILVFGVLMGFFTIPYVTNLMQNRLPATNMPVGFQYLVPTVIGFLIALVVVEQIITQIRRGTDEEQRNAQGAKIV